MLGQFDPTMNISKQVKDVFIAMKARDALVRWATVMAAQALCLSNPGLVIWKLFWCRLSDMLTHESGQLVRSLMSEALLDDEFAVFRKIR